MNPNEETMFMPNGQNVPQDIQNQVPPQAPFNQEMAPDEYFEGEEAPKKKGDNTWQAVAIGGVTGILLGTGGVLAANAMTSGDAASEDITDDVADTTEGGLLTAHVSDDMSFSQAFAAARAEVGPGGVFEWRGGLYGTFTADEWANMSQAERNEFAHDAYGGGSTHESHYTAHHTTVHHDHHVHHTVHHDDAQHDTAHHDHHGDPAGTTGEEAMADTGGTSTATHFTSDGGDVAVGDDDVQVVGVRDVEMGDGSIATVGNINVGGNDVFLVDVDRDTVFDYAMGDFNQDGSVTDDEVRDISDDNITVADLQGNPDSIDPGADDAGIAYTEQDLAPDAPDYMPTAEV